MLRFFTKPMCNELEFRNDVSTPIWLVMQVGRVSFSRGASHTLINWCKTLFHKISADVVKWVRLFSTSIWYSSPWFSFRFFRLPTRLVWAQRPRVQYNLRNVATFHRKSNLTKSASPDATPPKNMQNAKSANDLFRVSSSNSDPVVCIRFIRQFILQQMMTYARIDDRDLAFPPRRGILIYY